jgi:hypothetical protein
LGAVVGRAEAQVLRLAALYAVLDLSEDIEREHLMDALALWDYAEASARYVFGDATGNSVADQILDPGDGGMTRTDISNLFGRPKNAGRTNRALYLLLAAGRCAASPKTPAAGPPKDGSLDHALRKKRKKRK